MKRPILSIKINSISLILSNLYKIIETKNNTNNLKLAFKENLSSINPTKNIVDNKKNLRIQFLN